MDQQPYDLRNFPELVTFIEQKLHRSLDDVKKITFFADPPDSFVHQGERYRLPATPPHVTVTFTDDAVYLMEGPISYVPHREEEKEEEKI